MYDRVLSCCIIIKGFQLNSILVMLLGRWCIVKQKALNGKHSWIWHLNDCFSGFYWKFIMSVAVKTVLTWDMFSSSSSTLSNAAFLVSASSNRAPTSNTLSRYAWICTCSLSLSVCFSFYSQTATERESDGSSCSSLDGYSNTEH